MADDVLPNKAATIERCMGRAREEYAAAGDAFLTNFTRQDAAVLNVQRACEAALDMGHHLIRREFRTIAVPDCQRRVVPVAVNVMTRHRDEFLQFSASVLKRDGRTS